MAVPSPMLRLPWYSSVWNPSMEAPSLKKTVPSTSRANTVSVREPSCQPCIRLSQEMGAAAVAWGTG